LSHTIVSFELVSIDYFRVLPLDESLKRTSPETGPSYPPGDKAVRKETRV
jgi:hypothetical protein